MNRSCYFCIDNKVNLDMELDDAMDAWHMNKNTKTMIRACKAGKARQNWVLG